MFAGRAGKQLLKLPLTSVGLGPKDVQDRLWGMLLKLEVSEGGREARSLELGSGRLCPRTVALSVCACSTVHLQCEQKGQIPYADGVWRRADTPIVFPVNPPLIPV